MALHKEVAEDQLTYQLIGLAFRAQNEIGLDLPEQAYQLAMCELCEEEGLHVAQEVELPVRCNGKVVAHRRADMIIEREVVLELKAVRSLTDAHFRQLKTNLEASGLRRGLLFNFGAERVQHRRCVNAQYAKSAETTESTKSANELE
jgi:GxxExxY protein